MRFGCCVSRVDQLPAVRQAELDYLEVSVAGLVMAGGRGESERLGEGLRSGPPVLAANVFLPQSVHLVGPEAGGDDLLAYVREATRRLQSLGVRLLVFGSGGPRRIPEGYDRRRGEDELAGFCRRAAAIAREAGLTLVLEPLRRAESNVWNSLGEVAAFIRAHELEGVRLLADLYHMQEDGDPLAAVTEHADLLAHAHVAGPGRTPPRAGPELDGFLRRVGAAGPDLTCSIECRWNDLAAELPAALHTLRQTPS